MQTLYIPGLEPTYLPTSTAIKLEDENPPYTPWRGSEMYYKNGIEVKRKGVCEGPWVDERGWDRTLWSVAPDEEVRVGMEELWRSGRRLRINDEGDVVMRKEGDRERQNTPGL